ncbi:MAG TPA: sigma 54-interacting transcriptional regulator [Bryobacteraceae bacterium]|jgi:formate hydrogenlyase transcriptional activator|nr:sigma 54-interacting transcriptional regulator [Bryobacteraceae bacterium]
MGFAAGLIQRHAQTLSLRAWEAVSRERTLQGVLEAVTEVLLPVVPFDSIGIISFEGGQHDLFAMHIPGTPKLDEETLEEYMRRASHPTPLATPPRPRITYPPETPKKAKARIPYVCNDLLEREAWFEHEFHLAAGGVRSYAAIPLSAGDKLVGVAPFCRTAQMDFPPEQVMILAEVCRALAVAVDNAVANEELRKLRDRLEAENIALRTVLGQTPWFDDIAGSSTALRQVLQGIDQVAGTDATVLITGETGTGKELVARAIHRHSPRVQGPLIKVNCAAIPETLLASELFGHERGAFTGAAERRRGRFEQADGGTLFLDEVGEMPLETQVMLLRVLQEREFERVGGSRTVRVNVRIVAATNRDLSEQVQAGRFRKDLYYRLNVFPIHVPPLRERSEDIPALVAHFADKHGKRFHRTISRIDAHSLNALGAYNWPGNVRELENLVERAVIVSRDGILRVERDLPRPAVLKAPEKKLGLDLREKEREAIERALHLSKGRVSGPGGAAVRLGMPASTLEFRIRRLGINKHQFRAGA